MPTGTAALLPKMTFHVPVDRFQIVNGPDAVACMAAQNRLGANPQRYRNLVFTLKTAASTTTFRRTLKMVTIFAVEDGTFSFTAIFSGRVVSGIYSMNARIGWFSLD